MAPDAASATKQFTELFVQTALMGWCLPPYHRLSHQEKLRQTRILLEAGADPNITLCGYRADPSYSAHRLCSDEVCTEFLESSILRKLEDRNPGILPEGINRLRAQLKKVESMSDLSIVTYDYPLLSAAEARNHDMVVLLGQFGAHFNKSLDNIPSEMKKFLRNPFNIAINTRDYGLIGKLSRLSSPRNIIINDWIENRHAMATIDNKDLKIRFPVHIAWCLVETQLYSTLTHDIRGFTPLHVAVGDLTTKHLTWLLAHRSIPINAVDNFGMSPLLEAVFYGHLPAIRLLINEGADINQRVYNQRFFVQRDSVRWDDSSWYSRRDFAVTDFNLKHWSALHIAIHRGHTAIAKLLIDKGMDINLKDRDGNTEFDLATKQFSHNSVSELSFRSRLSTILEKGAHTQEHARRCDISALLCPPPFLTKTSGKLSKLNLAPNDKTPTTTQPDLCCSCSETLFEHYSRHPLTVTICWMCRLIDDRRRQLLCDCSDLKDVLTFVTNFQASETYLQMACRPGQHVQRHSVRTIHDTWHNFMHTWRLHDDDGTGSPPAIAMATRWLQVCLSSHPNCTHRLGAQYSPTRILDLDDDETSVVRLEQNAKLNSPYVALSHRWGTEDLPRTTSTNLDKHLQGIRRDEITHVMLDAIRVTKELGYRYLWIDALCIIQDSEQDWLQEASRMSDVFNGAIVTIAAADATNHSQGMFRPRRARCVRPFHIPYLEDTPYRDRIHVDGNGEFYVFPNTKFVEASNRPRCTLDTRAWILQEQVLSPRILYFGNGEIFWDCITLSASESSPVSSSLLFDERPDETWALRTIRKSLAGPTMRDVLKDRLPDIWIQVIQNYSSRQLTKQSDKLIALEGIIRPLRGIVQEEPVAGMWRSSLWRQLCWWVAGPKPVHDLPTEEENFSAPSWSWVSVNTSVYYHNSCPFDTKEKMAQQFAWSVKDLESHIEVKSVYVYKLHRATGIRGILTISGPSFRYLLNPNDMKKPIFKRWNAAKLNLNSGNWLLDTTQQLPLTVHCVVVAEDNVLKMLICLCLVQDELQTDKWRRVGLCHWDGLLWQVDKYVGKRPEERTFEIV